VATGCFATLPAHTGRAAIPVAPSGPAASGPSSLQRDIDAILADPALGHGFWGIVVRSLGTGETLYALNASKLMMPASNMKIVTLAAAAAVLRWEYTYETQLFAAGTIAGGALRGDLIVVGSGDPSITADNAGALFDEWADRLKQAGIRSVVGRVIGDDNAFEDEGLGFGWSWDDLQEDYAAPASALQFNENAVRVSIAPGPAAGDSAAIAIVPPGSGLEIVNNAVTVSGDSRITVSGAPEPTLKAHRLPGSMRLEITGPIPAGHAPVSLRVSVDNPTLFFASVLRQALIARGVDVAGPAMDVDDVHDMPARPASPIASHRSPPLSTLAMRLMKASQNLYAETFLKTLSQSTPRTAERGRARAAGILEGFGVAPDSLIQRDGSGLSRYDYVTVDALAAILTHVAHDESLSGPFAASLPIAGRDGSLANRMKGTAAEGNARAKTGSMTSVRGTSGYVTSASGEPLVFAILANNFETPPAAITAAEDAIIVRLATFRR